MKFAIFKIIIDIVIIIIPILFALPQNSFIYKYNFILRHQDKLSIGLIFLLVCAVICKMVAEWKLFKYKKSSKQFIETVKSYRSFLSGYIDDKLKLIAQNIEHTEDERVSIFLYSSSLDKFFSIGRYSHSPSYNKIGRYVIEDKKEYLYAVLNEAEHYDKSPKVNNEFWHFDKRNMESKDMLGVALFDKNNQHKIGVVVFQSMKEKKYSKRKTLYQKIQKQVMSLNSDINDMNINPNTLTSQNETLKGL